MQPSLVNWNQTVIIYAGLYSKEGYMKTLLFALPLMLIAVSCNNSKDAGTEYNQQREEVNKEFNQDVNEINQERAEEVNDLKEERNDELNEASEDLNEQQKEEAVDYVDEAEGARINRNADEVEVTEPAEE